VRSTWRFKNFNIDHREIESCRDAHRELQARIESLEDDVVEGLVEGILHTLPKVARASAVPCEAQPLTSVVSRQAWARPHSFDGIVPHKKPTGGFWRLAAALAIALPVAVWLIRRSRR
jgi:hypothetical protein